MGSQITQGRPRPVGSHRPSAAASQSPGGEQVPSLGPGQSELGEHEGRFSLGDPHPRGRSRLVHPHVGPVDKPVEGGRDQPL